MPGSVAARIVGVAFFVILAPGFAAAQVPPAPNLSESALTALEARRGQLFAAMLADPSNLDIAFEYAAISVQLGDIETAISTLERMLIFAPGLARVQLELGVLYHRLGADEVARSYFDAALSAPDVPPEVVERVRLYQAAIDEGQDLTAYTGSVTAGIRYQSNANAAPEARELSLNGTSFLLDPEATADPDFNVFLAANLHLAYDLQNQGDLFEVDVATYGAGYFDHDELNLLFGEVRFGPSFNLERFEIPDTRFGLYGILAAVGLDEHLYYASAGAGARLSTKLGLGTLATLAAEYRDRDYHDSDTYPTASLREGHLVRVLAGISSQVTSRTILRALGHAEWTETQVGFYDNVELGIAVGLGHRFEAPVPEGRPWTVNLDVGAVDRDFEDPDPTINLLQAEKDTEYFVRAGLVAPVADTMALLFSTEFRRSDSNYPTRDYDNLIVSVALTRTFGGTQ